MAFSRFATALAIGTAALAVASATLPAAQEGPSGLRPAFPADTGPAHTAATASAPPPEPEFVTRKARDVTPPGVTPGPKVTGPLLRIAPPPKPEKPKQPPEARQELIFRPVVVAAGTIQTSAATIRLAGIAATDPAEKCGTASWPCGGMARTALSRFIRGRAILCEVPPGAERVPDPALCRVGGRNIAEWLVEQGWARAAGEDFAAAEAKARSGKLGLWADDRPGLQPQEVQAAMPASSPDSALAIRARVSGMP